MTLLVSPTFSNTARFPPVESIETCIVLEVSLNDDDCSYFYNHVPVNS